MVVYRVYWEMLRVVEAAVVAMTATGPLTIDDLESKANTLERTADFYTRDEAVEFARTVSFVSVDHRAMVQAVEIGDRRERVTGSLQRYERGAVAS